MLDWWLAYMTKCILLYLIKQDWDKLNVEQYSPSVAAINYLKLALNIIPKSASYIFKKYNRLNTFVLNIINMQSIQYK